MKANVGSSYLLQERAEGGSEIKALLRKANSTAVEVVNLEDNTSSWVPKTSFDDVYDVVGELDADGNVIDTPKTEEVEEEETTDQASGDEEE